MIKPFALFAACIVGWSAGLVTEATIQDDQCRPANADAREAASAAVAPFRDADWCAVQTGAGLVDMRPCASLWHRPVGDRPAAAEPARARPASLQP